MKPSTSVIIPARNAETTLASTLDSLIGQTATGWEAIVINDASTDRTPAIAEEHARRDPRISWLDGPGEGVSAARNLGLSKAHGRWLLFLDSDDWISPDYLTRMSEAIEREPSAVAAYCADRRVTPSGEVGGWRWRGEIALAPFEAFARHCSVAIHAVLVERSVVMDVGGFDPSLLTCEDWDLWQRVARTGGKFVGVPDALAFYRMSDQSLTTRFARMVADARTVIARGFASDPRVPEAAFAHASDAYGNGAEASLAYFALWCAAVVVGRGDDGVAFMRCLSAPPDLMSNVPDATMMIVDALTVGARCTEAALAANWTSFSQPLSALLRHCEDACSRKGLSRRLQYAIERELLRHADLAVPAALGFTMALRVDLRNLTPVRPPPSVDLLFIKACAGPEVVADIEYPVFGELPARELAVLAIETIELHQYWKLARPYRTPRWWLISAGKLPRVGGRIMAVGSCTSNLRPMVKNVAQSAAIEAAGPAPEPTSSRMRLEAIIAETRHDAAIRAHPVSAQPTPPQRLVTHDRRSFWESYFEKPDPWNYGSDYEQTKYRRTLDLVRQGTRKALEIGCAEGHFTALLGKRVDELLAVDISETALRRARCRCGEQANVRFGRLDLSIDPLPDAFDLIVCSEMLYYLKDETELSEICNKLASALAPDGQLLTAHSFLIHEDLRHTGFDWDAPFGARAIAETLSCVPSLTLERSIETELYRIDLWRHTVVGEQPVKPAIETLSIGANLTPDVARLVVWGGAQASRAELTRTTAAVRVPVLLYHRIATDGPPALSRYRVSPDRFLEQMRWLRRQGYEAVTSAKLVEHMIAHRPLAGRPVVITFDDGTLDFYREAWPVLYENSFSAEVFVVTDLVGSAAIWDSEFGPPAPLMSRAEITALAQEGVQFGSHLATHQDTNALSSRDLAVELVRSRVTLQTWLGQPISTFAAPYGSTSERLVRIAAWCGYTTGFTTERGVAQLDGNPLQIPRLEIKGNWALERFAAELENTR